MRVHSVRDFTLLKAGLLVVLIVIGHLLVPADVPGPEEEAGLRHDPATVRATA